MKLSVVGSGWMETTIAACTADLGHEVIDIDPSIVKEGGGTAQRNAYRQAATR